MTPITQTIFGGPDDEVVGNCYPSCLASLLEIGLDEIPHFYQMHRKNSDASHAAILDFLMNRGYTAMNFEWADWINQHAPGALAIFTGKSPRGDWDHAVIGEITADGWKLIHDPHPSRDGIMGKPTHCELVFKIMKIAQA